MRYSKAYTSESDCQTSAEVHPLDMTGIFCKDGDYYWANLNITWFSDDEIMRVARRCEAKGYTLLKYSNPVTQEWHHFDIKLA